MVKVLTIKQPWAQLVVEGHKTIETRDYRTSHRGELFIHSSKNPNFLDLELCQQEPTFKRCIPDPTRLMSGYILGRVKVIECVPVEKIVTGLTHQERVFGNYGIGRFAWILDEPELIEPIRCSGKLGIWEYDVKQVWMKGVING